MASRTFTRRRALRNLSALAGASPLLQAQEPPAERLPPREELVNVFEVEDVARRRLSRSVFESVARGAGGEATLHRNREFFDRITFVPRVLVNVMGLDLTVDLFGEKVFCPILVGPTSRHQRAHAEGELATARGAGAAKAILVVSSRSGFPIEQIAAQAKSPLWYQIDPDSNIQASRERVQRAVQAGCKAICLTVGASYQPVGAGSPPDAGHLATRSNPAMNWAMLDQLRSWSKVPVLLKGIVSPEEARMAVEKGAQGIIVSNHGGRFVDGEIATIEALPRVSAAVGGRAPVLIDGGFRRGTDILKALALGARAVLLGRPPLWGLGAYGADGVQLVLEMLQAELALAMGLCGKPNLAAVDASVVKIHKR